MTGRSVHGTPAAFREFAADALTMASIQAELGRTFAEIGDDVGLEYALRRATAYFRCALGALHDLKEAKAARSSKATSHDSR